MESRIAIIGIIVEDIDASSKVNDILHDYGMYILGRMGIPYHEKGVNIISCLLYTSRELSRIISREIKDPRIAPMTSVVDAVVTSDLKQCKAYISVLGNDEEKEETMKGLNSAVGYIRRELAHSINLRNTPEITFILDDSIEYGVNMSKKIDELNHGSENETL